MFKAENTTKPKVDENKSTVQWNNIREKIWKQAGAMHYDTIESFSRIRE